MVAAQTGPKNCASISSLCIMPAIPSGKMTVSRSNSKRLAEARDSLSKPKEYKVAQSITHGNKAALAPNAANTVPIQRMLNAATTNCQSR